MASDDNHSQEYAERPKEGELWQEMVHRQQRDGSNQGGFSRELMRSLPDEEQKEKEGPERGDITPLSPALIWDQITTLLGKESNHQGAQADQLAAALFAGNPLLMSSPQGNDQSAQQQTLDDQAMRDLPSPYLERGGRSM
jgi:hypothetical protein